MKFWIGNKTQTDFLDMMKSLANDKPSFEKIIKGLIRKQEDKSDFYIPLVFDEYRQYVKVEKTEDEKLGCSYIFTTIQRTINENESIQARVRTTNVKGEEPVWLFDYMDEENVLFSINAGIFNTGTLEPECLLIMDREIMVDRNETYEHHDPKDGGDKRYELHILRIDQKGDLHFYKPGTTAKEILNKGCVDAVMGFVPLIDNYKEINEDDSCAYISKVDKARQVIGIDKDGDYFILTINAPGTTLEKTRKLLRKHGVKLAYDLDGGKSTQTVFHKESLTPYYLGETGRKIQTIITFEVITGNLIINKNKNPL